MSYYIPAQRNDPQSDTIYETAVIPEYSSTTPLTQKGTDQKFQKTGPRDLLFLVLFFVNLFVFAIFFIVGLAKARGSTYVTGNIFPIDDNGFRAFLGTCSVGLVCSIILAFIWLLIVRAFARLLIIFTIVFSIMSWLAAGLAFIIVSKTIWAGILAVLTALIYLWIYWIWRHRIPFATIVLKTVSGVITEYPGTTYTSFVSLLIQIVWIILWTVTAVNIQFFSSSPGVVYTLFTFLVFSFYWVYQVIKNVVHVTVSGTIATWYFLQSSPNMPANPTASSLLRACTTSLGSICLGSLLVALLQTLRWFIRSLRSDRVIILRIFLDCILGCLESLLRYFNKYAFTQVAIYGKTYCQASRDTHELIASHGVEAIINDDIIAGVLVMGTLLGGLVTAVITTLVSLTLVPGYWAAAMMMGFAIGVIVQGHVMEVVDSGVASVFVCFAMDPQALARSAPHLYNKFKEFDERT